MFRVTDLKAVSVATSNLDAAVATFRKTFGFAVSRSTAGPSVETRSVWLRIGGAEIEMSEPTGERGPGLHQLVLEVDDLEATRAGLAERGIEVSIESGADGRRVGMLRTTQTHGVPITLVER